MKKLFTILMLIVSITLVAQEQPHNNTKGELNTNTPTSKFVQGALTGTALYVVSNSLQRGNNKWISHTISIVGSILFEGLTNKQTNLEKMSFVGGGAITVNVTFEIFKPKKCNRHNY